MRCLHVSEKLPAKYLLNYRGKNSPFTVEKPGRYDLSQAVKVNSTRSFQGQTETGRHVTGRATAQHPSVPPCALVCPGCCITDGEAYKQQECLPHSLEAGSPSSRCPQILCLGRVPRRQSSHCVLTCWKVQEALWGPIYKGTNPIHKSSTLTTSQGPTP